MKKYFGSNYKKNFDIHHSLFNIRYSIKHHKNTSLPFKYYSNKKTIVSI